MPVDRILPRSWFQAFLGAVALMFLGGAILFAVSERTGGPSSTDLGFLHDMITHHEQAILMSNAQIVNGDSDASQLFAREILQQQAYEIGMMQRRLEQWGQLRDNRPPVAMEWMGMSFMPQEMPGMASADEMRLLADASGPRNDALFFALMADHHRGGVEMAAAAAADAQDPWVRDLATSMERNQAIEINEMDAARARLGLPEFPEGFEPGEFMRMGEMGSGEADMEMGEMDMGDGTDG